jgi:rubredoxin
MVIEMTDQMVRYKCSVCGHTYDPKKGEPLQNILPGIEFTDLPDDWKCPICGARKDQFVKVQE